jgi:hypothetical protein
MCQQPRYARQTIARLGWRCRVRVAGWGTSAQYRIAPRAPRELSLKFRDALQGLRARCTFAIALFVRCGEQCSGVHASGSGQAVDGLRKKG